MNVLMLLSKSTLHDPRVLREATTLTEAGHDVHVLEWCRHHPDGPETEVHEGITIHRVLDPFSSLPLPARMPGWWRRAAKRGQVLARTWRPDAVHAHDLDTLPAAVRIARALDIPLVYDAHEPYDIMIQADHPLGARMARILEDRLLRHVDHLITVSPAMADHFASKGVAGATLIQNCPPALATPPPWPLGDTFRVVYIGTLQPERFFPDAVDALGSLPGITFVVAGKNEGVYDAVERAAEGHANVEFHGTIPAAEVVPLTATCHAVLCLFDPARAINRIGSPNKLFEAMATGRPIIVAKGTDAGRFVEQEEIGLAIPYDAASLRAAVKRLADDPSGAKAMGERGRKLALAEFNWEAQAARLRALYDDLRP